MAALGLGGHQQNIGVDNEVKTGTEAAMDVGRTRLGDGNETSVIPYRLQYIERIGHTGRIAGRLAAPGAPFLSPTMWERHDGLLGGGGGRAGSMGPGLFG